VDRAHNRLLIADELDTDSHLKEYEPSPAAPTESP
jgi:hypothetical protein